MTYNVVLVLAGQQSDSIIHTHTHTHTHTHIHTHTHESFFFDSFLLQVIAKY